MKPVIGISVDCDSDPEKARTGGIKLSLNWNYAEAVASAGGIPLLIPPHADPAEVLPLLDGLMIPGGNDIDARNWGEANHPSVETIADERFEAEKRLYKSADPAMPILGICYGCQFLNVVRGGSLLQHLPDVPGRTEHTKGVMQTYELESGSKLGEAVGGVKATGESWHHQAINSLGSHLKVVAKSEDETIEAIEAKDRPWLVGVQWHPERTLSDEATQQLFGSFIKAAAAYRNQKGKAGALR